MKIEGKRTKRNSKARNPLLNIISDLGAIIHLILEMIVSYIFKNIFFVFKILFRFVTISVLLSYLVSIVLFCIKTGKFQISYTNQQIKEYIQSDFDKRYKIDILEEKLWKFGESSFVVFADDKKQVNYCPSFFEGNKAVFLSPVLKIYDKRTDLLSMLFPYLPPIKPAFEFNTNLIGENHSGGKNLFITEKRIIDLDNDGKKEIILRLMTATCGSGAEIFNFIFSRNENTYILAATLPESSYFKEAIDAESGGLKINSIKELFELVNKNGWKPANLFETQEILINGKKQSIFFGTSDDYINFVDIDHDDSYEVIVAKMDWKISENCFKDGTKDDPNCECHWCPHNWLIGVFKYKDGDFILDNKFNNGLLFPTEEKYNLSDIMGYQPYPVNLFGVISGYYGLGFFETRNEDLSFNFTDRSKSKVLDIIEEYYNK